MALKWPKHKCFLFYAALILTNVIIMNDLVVVPIVNDLYTVFADHPMGVSTIISAPSIVTIFAALIVPRMMKKWSHRQLIVACSVLFCVVSIFGCAVENVYYMIACRVICGFCYAVINVVYVALVAEVFVDVKRRAQFMGVFNGMMSLIGAVMGFAAGMLATGGWQQAYRVYWAAVPMLIMVIFFIPKPADIDTGMAESGEEEVFGDGTAAQAGASRFPVMMLVFLIFNICYTLFSNFNSVYVMENGLGNQAFAGTLTSVGTIASAVICMLFGAIYEKLRGKVGVLCCASLLVGTALCCFIPSQLSAMVNSVLSCMGYGVFMTFVYTHTPSIVAPEKVESSIGLITAVSCIGMTLSSYIQPWLTGLFGGSFTSSLMVSLCAVAVITVVEIISVIKTENRN